MKRHYYTGYCDAIDEKGESFSLVVMGEHGNRKFKSKEELKRAIDKMLINMSRKDTTRTYEDGRQVRLSYRDLYDIKFFIEEHFDEVNEEIVFESKRAYNEQERKFEEEISL